MKVLIISHTPLSTKNNMGKTFLSLFSSFQKEELCQLYIYPSYPDEMYCSSFYRVTDKDVIKSLTPGGEVKQDRVQSTNELYEDREDEAKYRNVKNKSDLRRLLRDGIWMGGTWYNRKLKDWLDREKPDCIFLAPGPAKFVYWIATKIAKARKLPLVTYVCDEYYFVQPETSWLGKLRLGLFKKTMKKTMHRTRQVVGISQEIREHYGKEFGVPVTVLMTGGSGLAESPREIRKPVTELSYFGNIRLNRYLSLAAIGKALDRINEARGTAYKLKLYTGEKDPLFLSAFDGIASVERSGFLTGEAFQKAMEEAQVLVHVEAFDEASIDRVRHSISTKIADALSGGTPLFAYGPEGVSSIRHLLRNDCAVVVTKEEQLEAQLCALLDGKLDVSGYVSNALKTAARFHNTQDNSARLYELMNQLDFNK